MTASSDFTVHVLGRDDIDFGRVAALVNAAFAIYPFMSGPRTSPEGVVEELGDSGQLIVAEDEHRLAACAMIRPAVDVDWGDELPAEDHAQEADAMYLGLVGVEPSLRKSGLGRRIIAEAESRARQRGFARMVLGTLAEMGNVVYYGGLDYHVVVTTHYEAGHWGLTIPHEFCVMAKTL